jgi:tetratricopeptide (TPR) repeat protein
MKKTLLLTFFLFFALTKGFAQDYTTLAKQGYRVYEAKDYAKSVEIFEQAFKLGKPKASDLYNAACSAALATQTDKAFDFLGKAIDAGYSNLGHLKGDTDLTSLYQDNRWKEIIAKIENNLADELAKLKYPKIAKMLDSMVVSDQAFRHQSTELRNKGLDWFAPEIQKVLRNMQKADSSNMVVLKKLFKEYGFLGFEEVGKQGSNNFWLMMQHCDTDPKFQEEVLADMKKHIERKNASPSNYAYLIDRVNVNTGKPQVYGTQMKVNNDQSSYEPKPVIDPENLNKRRAEVGLGTIEEYIGIMNSRYKGSLKNK